MLQQKAIIKDYKQDEAGAYFIVHVPNWTPENKLSDKCELHLNDGRSISTGQRSFVHALLRDVAKHYGWTEKAAKATMKKKFIEEHEKDYFSLSATDMTTARDFIEYNIEFMFLNEVPISKSNVPLMKNTNKFFYMCVAKRKCAVCGKYAEIHHVDSVGAGRDRTKINHTKHRLIALCHEHHRLVHGIGWEQFSSKFHVAGIYVDVETLKKLNIKGDYEG